MFDSIKAIKEDIAFKIASRQIAIDIWAQKFLKNLVIDDQQLQELYKKHSPKMQPSYKLRNILHKNEADADKVMKTLKETKGMKKQSKKFKQLALNESEDFTSRKNGGEIGWIDANKLDPAIQNALKDKKQGDIVKAEVKNIGWQVLIIDEIKPQRPATFKESKETLLQVAKQEMLNQEIKKLIESK